ncbi:cell division transport system permease protein [Nitrosomonas sp. Nm51]|uniref:permease-like cell division protein FtsX n=1 Tax=Nitrosomonas sp. Nm51 TaxID=133720 RepID=UPI0008ADA237|nr:permease-like cell division protein FtsX [Nitrosomonas sp. Nm51]SER50119.1 cell division transport system permease protein [Nitrosomonas sp. Nm51]
MIRAWLSQHSYVLVQVLKRMVASPVTSLLSALVMGIAFSLPVGFYLFLQNMHAISGQNSVTPQMSLFLKQSTTGQDIAAVRERLQGKEQVAHIQFISKDQALLQLQQSGGAGNVVPSLGRNPLPDAFVVDVQNAHAEALERLQIIMQKWPEIEYVQFDSVWAERLEAILSFGRVITILLFTLLSVAVVAVMFNTIRLQILTRRDEIELSKLIGATDGFIQRPFLYFGAIQGLIGGITAWLIIALALQMINDELKTLAGLYAWDIHLQHLSNSDSISLLLFAAWIGWLGARLAVASHLWQTEPGS